METKTDDFHCIKVPLLKILRDPNKDLKTILDAVKNVHIIVSLAYQLVRLYYLKLFASDTVLPILDKQMYQSAISIISFPNKKVDPSKQALKDFYHAEFKATIPANLKYQVNPLSTILQSQTTEMITAYSNNITMHFIPRLRRVIKQMILIHPDFSKLESYDIRRGVNLIYNCLWDRNASQLNEKLLPIYQECLKNYIPTEPYEESLAYDLKVNTDRYLLPTMKMNNFLANSGCKQFQSLPIRTSNVPCHISLDTNALIIIFDDLVQGKNKDELHANYNKDHILRYCIWDKIFKMGTKLFKIDLDSKKPKNNTNSQFFYSIATDGVSCSLKFCNYIHIQKHANRYRKKEDKLEIDRTKKDTLLKKSNKNGLYKMSELSDDDKAYFLSKHQLGGDPGMSNLIQLTDDNKKQVKYTRRQRYQESYMDQNRELNLRLRKENNLNEIEKPLNQYNSKSLDFAHFKDFLTKKNEIMVTTMTYYNKLAYRNMRLRKYIYTKRSEARLIRNIKTTFGDDCVILYGNWSRTSNMKYNAPVPGKGLRNLIARYFPTITTDESNSSSVCYYCQKRGLKNRVIKIKDKSKKLHRCLVCEECCSSKNGSKVQRFINRDIMGSLNILMLGKCDLANKERPEAYKKRSLSNNDGVDPFGTIVCTVQKIDQKKMVMKPAILKSLPIKIV